MWDEGGSDEILGVQHDAPVGLAVGQGLIGVAYGGEWVRCGDGDVQVAGSGEGGQFGQRRGAAGIGRSEGFDALLFRSAIVDDGVDAVYRNAEVDGEVDVAATDGVDEGIGSVGRGEDPFLFAVAVLDRLDAILEAMCAAPRC